MTSATRVVGGFEIGRVVQNAASAIHKNFVSFLVLSAIAVGPPAFLMSWAPAWMAANETALEADLTRTLLAVGGIFAGLILYLVGAMLLQAAVIHGAFADLSRGRATLAEMVAAGLRKLAPLVGFGVVVGLAISSGLIVMLASPRRWRGPGRGRSQEWWSSSAC